MKKTLLLLPALLFLSGCDKYHISVVQETIGIHSLASVALGTPDPEKNDPPEGERLIIEWKIAEKDLLRSPILHLQVVYKDYTEAEISYPMKYKTDYVVYDITGQEYREKKGILGYRIEARVENGTPVLTWQHQLFVRPIVIQDTPAYEEEADRDSWIESNSSSVSSHPRQGSVNEIEGEGSEEESN